MELKKTSVQMVQDVKKIETSAFEKPYNDNQIFLALRAFEGWIAYENKQPAGYILYKYKDSYHGKKNLVWLRKIGVDPKFQGKGIGKALMEKMLEFAKGKKASTIGLRVRPENKAAIGFYEKLGFNQSKYLKSFYKDGGDAVEMEKDL